MPLKQAEASVYEDRAVLPSFSAGEELPGPSLTSEGPLGQIWIWSGEVAGTLLGKSVEKVASELWEMKFLTVGVSGGLQWAQLLGA